MGTRRDVLRLIGSSVSTVGFLNRNVDSEPLISEEQEWSPDELNISRITGPDRDKYLTMAMNDEESIEFREYFQSNGLSSNTDDAIVRRTRHNSSVYSTVSVPFSPASTNGVFDSGTLVWTNADVVSWNAQASLIIEDEFYSVDATDDEPIIQLAYYRGTDSEHANERTEAPSTRDGLPIIDPGGPGGGGRECPPGKQWAGMYYCTGEPTLSCIFAAASAGLTVPACKTCATSKSPYHCGLCATAIGGAVLGCDLGPCDWVGSCIPDTPDYPPVT